MEIDIPFTEKGSDNLCAVKSLRFTVDALIKRLNSFYPDLQDSPEKVERVLVIEGESEGESTTVSITKTGPRRRWLQRLVRKRQQSQLEITFKLFRPNTDLVVNEKYSVSSQDNVLLTSWNNLSGPNGTILRGKTYCTDKPCPPNEIDTIKSRLEQACYSSEKLTDDEIASQRLAAAALNKTFREGLAIPSERP